MYRVKELGDCFLLLFEQGDNKSSVLIDCGSFRNSENSVAHLNKIASHISRDLKSQPLSVVVGTHQHNDHLSGFTHASETWKSLGANEAWLSWLDDPDDRTAMETSREHKRLAKNLHNISSGLLNSKNERFTENSTTQRVTEILGFYGAKGNDPVVPAMGLETIRQMSKSIRYLHPGQILDLPGLPSNTVKVYVLGPPKNPNHLFDIHAGKKESYDHKLAMANTLADNYLKALSNFDKSNQADPDEEYFPFDIKNQKSPSSPDFLKSIYCSKDKEWRKIDTVWLEQAERLGLYLDSYTNNTSLVLAFELVESGKILLFVGDAQTGNWLSWKDILWKDKDSDFDIHRILSKTVLYKVGHHCSHNATLVAGLEAMNHPELVAMIPVDRNDPHIKKEKGWRMPASQLYRRLKEKTKFRLLRMDDMYDNDCNPELHQYVRDSWKGLQLPNKDPKGLYYSYTIQG
jgi:hypothetical protein